MSDIHPDAVSLEDAPAGAQIESQPIAQPTADATPEAEDAEPDGVVEVAPGKRMVDVSIVAAERRRARETAERRKDQEYEPLKQAAAERDQLRAALAEVRPIIEQVRQRPELLQPPKPTPIEEQISDEDATQEARDLELYRSDGQPDIVRAKRIIARRYKEASHAARQATEAVVGPITSHTAQQASRQNLERLALQRDPDGEPVLGRLVDPQTLAKLWAQLPPEMTQHPEVAEIVLDAAIGQSVRKGGRVARPERGPVISEPAGGRGGPAWTPNDTAKKIAREAGLSDKDLAASAKTYVPGGINVIGD